MSGHRGSAARAVSLDSAGDVTGTEKVAWHLDRGMPYVPSPLLHGDQSVPVRGTAGDIVGSMHWQSVGG